MFLTSTIKGVVLGGYHGELIAQFLLLQAWGVAASTTITYTIHIQ